MFSLNLPGVAYAATNEVDSGVRYMPNVEQVLTGEAKLNIITNLLRKCYLHNRESQHPDGGKEILDPDRWFNNSTNVGNVGAFVELELQGEIEDGFVYCYDDDGKTIFQAFADYARLDDVKYIFCDPDGGPGTAHIEDSFGRCNQNGEMNDSDYEYVTSGGAANAGAHWDTYLKSIYEARAKGGKPVWENGAWRGMTEEEKAAAGYADEAPWFSGDYDYVGNFDKDDHPAGGYMAYGMYMLEIKTGCGNETEGSAHSSNKLKRLDDYSAYWETFVSGDDSAYPVPKTTSGPARGSHHWSFASWGKDKTCNEFIQRTGTFTEFVQPIMLELIESGCEEAFKKQKEEFQAMLNDADSSEEKKEYATNAIAEYNAMVSAGKFTEAITNSQNYEGLKCKTTEYLANVEQAEWNLDEQDEPYDEQRDCYNKAGSLGWIVCPLITTGAEMVQTTYEGMVVPFLRMDPKLFGSDGGTYNAWNVFRNLANIAFVIVFLIVIFSQLTGYGIDNYGIKKILPKLVVAAILINMSYIICQLAIDIANIIGGGIGALFTGIGDQIASASPTVCTANGADACRAVSANTSGGAGSWIAIIAVVIAITAVALLAIGPQILIPVLLAIISFVIAVFFLFVILGVRQALAVILVAFSPLAFLCYMLPNTKKIFDKWFTTLKGILLAYPICSAMVYGGDMVAKIILSNYGTEATDLASMTPILSAGVVAIAPIFLIPGTIKKSMAGIGALSARLQGGLTHRARGAANRRLQNSPLTHRQRYREKARMDRANARMGEYNNRRAGKTLNRMNNRMAKSGQTLGDMSAAQRRKYMMATGMASAHDNEMRSAYAASFDGMAPDQISSAFQNMVKSGKYDKNLASAAITKLADSNQHDVLNDMLKKMDDDFISGKDGIGITNQADRMALGNQLAGLKNINAAAGLYGKSLAKGGSAGMGSYMQSSFRADVANAGKNIVSSQDDSALKFIAQNGGSFTAEQMRNSIGSLDTKQQDQMQGLWSNMSDADRAETFTGMSTEQYAKVDESVAKAVGGGSLDAGRDFINSNTTTQRQALMSDEGEKIRAGQTASQQAMSDWSKAGAAEKARVTAQVKDWSTLSQEERDAYCSTMPQRAGESLGDYQARVLSSYASSPTGSYKAAAKAAGYKV